MKKTILAAFLAVIAAAAIFAGLCLYRDYTQRAYVTEMNHAAKAFYACVNSYLTEHPAEKMPDGIYDCTYYPQHADKAACFQFSPEDGSPLTAHAFTAADFGISEHLIGSRMYYVLEIRGNAVTRVCACERNILSADDLDAPPRANDPYELTLAELYLNRFIACYPR